MEEKLNAYRAFCEREFKDFTRAVENGWDDIANARNCGLQRCIGVADFLQITENIPFDDTDKIYMEYRRKFYELYAKVGENV